MSSTINESLQAGLEHHRAGRLREAEQMYRDVLSRHPRNAQAIHLLGLIAFQLGRPVDSIQCLRLAAQLDANNPTFHADLGDVLRTQGEVTEAIAACQKALELKPDMADVHHCLGVLYKQQDDLERAEQCFRQALAVDPNHAASYGSLGTLLRTADQMTEAQAMFERAVQLSPTNGDYYWNLGLCLYELGQRLEAIACYQQTLRLSPGNAKPQFNCALARLAVGDFEQGWREFELRHVFDDLVRRRYDLPPWTGGEIPAGAVLVHAEQGFGDAIQFARYVPMLVERGVRVVFDVHEELVSLFQQSGMPNVRADGVAPPECTHQFPLMSLPRLFGTTVETIPAKVPYLTVREDLVAKWRNKLTGVAPLRVGIHWQGRAEYYNDRARSIPLRMFAPLAAIPGVQLVSLQTGAGADQLTELAGSFPVLHVGHELTDFHETAALMRNLDLVISCDSAPAHLAGALALPVWVPLTVGGDWRWLGEGEDTPWYPTMRLFRQQTRRQWQPVFDRIAVALRERTRQSR
jgi:Flp pilus assembly protein TadD